MSILGAEADIVIPDPSYWLVWAVGMSLVIGAIAALVAMSVVRRRKPNGPS
jgi:hypothetical protein